MNTAPPSFSRWRTVTGPLSAEQVLAAVAKVAERHSLDTRSLGGSAVALSEPCGGRTAVTARWQELPPQPPRTLGHLLTPPPAIEILIDSGPPGSTEAAEDLYRELRRQALPYTAAELDNIRASMPLLERYSKPGPDFDGWALLFRDHHLEHSVGFLLAVERAGVPAEWIFVLDKGDRTYNRDRVRATFTARGYHWGLLDNTAVNAAGNHADELRRATAEVDDFIDRAHDAGRRVLVIDDGGLLAQGYGSATSPRRVDAAIELTVSGLKRISAAGELGIPVMNLARSQVKTLLGYREIADSCMRSLRALLPDRKFIGRQVLLIGYGTLGSRLAPQLRTLGCRVAVVDTDLPTLIQAAEAGYTTYRTAAEALASTDPFVVIGTTGAQALTEDDLRRLPDGVLLAPFATRDFSVLADHQAAAIPGVGSQYRLSTGRTLTVLGDGRSMNLYEADSIPNQGYDAYRAGTLIAARALCTAPDRLPPGLHTTPADTAIADAGLFDTYYNLYNATFTTRPAVVTATSERPAQPTRACIVGYGNAGRLHTRILGDLGAELTIIDPKHQHLPAQHRTFRHGVDGLPSGLATRIDIWSICTPTADHLPVLRAILRHNPAGRILLEKPACQGHEIDSFTALLDQHPQARVTVVDQYQHSTALTTLTEVLADLEPGAAVSRIGVAFTKDRGPDIAAGRFIDRTYGVLGYEWLHMLTVLGRILPGNQMSSYLNSPPDTSELWATHHPDLFLPALTEHTTLTAEEPPVRIELSSSILAPSVPVTSSPATTATWRRGLRPADAQQRHVTLYAGTTRFAAHLDPVTTADGHQLDRNHHRITATRAGHIRHEEVLHDSPLDTAIGNAVTQLLAGTPLPSPNLLPLRRIAALADALRPYAAATALDNRHRALSVGSEA
ncbi:hypothetical protein [Streptomyces sodiiphilus]|uniref:hypothetical protein n=1 Tax=Streptomyces sodiiphilus TaxID=226217 RepID=UPI0031DA5044